MAGYFNDGNGVKNITDGYFYDGDVKYYKDVVTTKYWKEVTTTVKGDLEYGCYIVEDTEGIGYSYAKVPIGSDMLVYIAKGNVQNKASSSDDLGSALGLKFGSLSEEQGSILDTIYYRSYVDDLYIDTTVTETVEGTPEDYTYTTEEVTTVEVSADDEYDYKEYYPKKIKQIYKVINGEAKLIFNNE